MRWWRLLLVVTIIRLRLRGDFVVLPGGGIAGLGEWHCRSIVSDDFVTWMPELSQLVMTVHGMGDFMTHATLKRRDDP